MFAYAYPWCHEDHWMYKRMRLVFFGSANNNIAIKYKYTACLPLSIKLNKHILQYVQYKLASATATVSMCN